jgi:hypothetical protein
VVEVAYIQGVKHCSTGVLKRVAPDNSLKTKFRLNVFMDRPSL